MQPIKAVIYATHWTKERFWASKPETFVCPDDFCCEAEGKTEEEDICTDAPCPELECTEDAGAGEQKPPEPEDSFKMTIWLAICLAVLLEGSFLSAMDYTSIGTIVSTVSADLGGTTSESEWIGNGYALMTCVAQLPISSLSDIFGRRPLIVFTFVMFLVGSIVCGTAHNMSAMIAGRFIQGTGSAGTMVLTEIVLAETIPLRLRGLYYSIFMFVWSAGQAVGPIFAGAFAQYATWRWMFYLNLPLCGLALAGIPFIKLKRIDQHWKEKLRQVDYGGAVLVTASSTSLVLGLARGGAASSWDDWTVIVPIVLGFVGLGITAVYELYAKISHPMFNVRVFKNMTAAMCYLQNVLQGVVYLGMAFYLPTFFQGAKSLGQLMDGVAILPLSVAGPPVTLLVGWIITRTGH